MTDRQTGEETVTDTQKWLNQVEAKYQFALSCESESEELS